jgi:hypothetical protein
MESESKILPPKTTYRFILIGFAIFFQIILILAIFPATREWSILLTAILISAALGTILCFLVSPRIKLLWYALFHFLGMTVLTALAAKFLTARGWIAESNGPMILMAGLSPLIGVLNDAFTNAQKKKTTQVQVEKNDNERLRQRM